MTLTSLQEVRAPNHKRKFLRSGILSKQVVKRDRVADERLFHLYNDMLIYSKVRGLGLGLGG